jgi:hypothetical protein
MCDTIRFVRKKYKVKYKGGAPISDMHVECMLHSRLLHMTKLLDMTT